MAPRDRSASGFSLLEVLIASALLASALVGLAHLAALGVRQTQRASTDVSALALAQSKLEALKSVPWTYDAGGAPVSDPALSASPPGALTADSVGYFDLLDRFGRSVPSADGPSVVYRRRWAVAPVDPLSADTLALRVCVWARGGAVADAHSQPDACVSTARTRKP